MGNRANVFQGRIDRYINYTFSHAVLVVAHCGRFLTQMRGREEDLIAYTYAI